MNYVKQAFELSCDKKLLALELYEHSVAVLVNKNYVQQVGDAHTELSALFNGRWVNKMKKLDAGNFAELIAEGNVAFNYANFNLGCSGKFEKTAKRLTEKSSRVGDNELRMMGKTMNCILTATTAEQIEAEWIFD